MLRLECALELCESVPKKNSKSGSSTVCAFYHSFLDHHFITFPKYPTVILTYTHETTTIIFSRYKDLGFFSLS